MVLKCVFKGVLQGRFKGFEKKCLKGFKSGF